MGGLFSKKKKSRVNQHDKAVLDLKVSRDKLKDYKKKCELVIGKETEIAKKLLKEGKKKQAVLALKKKKYQEQLLEKADTQLSNISEMIDSVEFAQIEQKVIDGLKQGNDVLKEIHGQMSLEEIDNLMLDTQEAIEYQQQIEEALSGALTHEDEDAVMAELEELTKEALDLPDVPTDRLPEATPESATAAKSKAKAKEKKAELVPA